MFIKKNKEEIIHLQDAYYRSLNAPIDDYWQHVIASGDFYELENGYFIIDKCTLMQYVQDPFSEEDFLRMLSTFTISKAQVCTYEKTYLQYVQKYFPHSKRIAFFYKDVKDVEIEFPDIIEKLATLDDLKLAVDHSEGPEDWLLEYLNGLIKKESLYVYFLNQKLIGTGELRFTDQSTYANIGMTVVPEYRRRYIGSYILNRMKILAKEKGYTPICGTDLMNIGSQKTISRCGFEKHHYVREFSL